MVRASIRKFLASALVDAVVRVVVVASVIISGLAWYQTRELAQCVASYANANNVRSVALTEAAEQERNAERKADDAQAALFLSPIVSKPVGQRTTAEQTELLRLFRAYQDALTEQTRERATADGARTSHPIPDPPNEVCD